MSALLHNDSQWHLKLLFLLGLHFFNLCVSYQSEPSYTTIYQWKLMDFQFPSIDARLKYIKNRSFIPQNVALGGIKVWNNRLYISIPRFRPGVPVTLTSAPYNPISRSTISGMPLEPFPNWAMQQIGNCEAFQYVQSMEIDQFGRMWIIDTGRINLVTDNPINLCTPKLVIMDLDTTRILRTYKFPAAVASPTETFLDDLVVACKTKRNCFAYIVNTNQQILTIYSFRKNKAWSVSHPTMNLDPYATNFTIKGKTYNIAFGLDGIAISPYDENFNRIYYSPVASYNLYSVETETLKRSISNGIVPLEDSMITHHGTGISQADGLAMDSGGLLYYGRLTKNTLAIWISHAYDRNFVTDVPFRQNDTDMEWIDSLAFDNAGSILFTSDRLNVYLNQGYNPNDYNLRIIRAPTLNHRKSYMYSATSFP